MTIPLHYSERYVNQRYNKALQIVQYLPASSSFQPTRQEKLELYAYYKQVSHGDINTPRPGLFDMVGRAKWDAWKKLEGIDRLEARYQYTETLLRSATEAYKRNAGRSTAEQIIQAFALMHPSGDHDSEGDEITDDTNTTHDEGEDDGSSIASAEAEEQAYLYEVQVNANNNTATPRRRLVSPRQQHQRLSWYERASSATSSMITAPTGQSRTTSPSNDRLLPHMIPPRERAARQQAQRNSASYDEDNLDPWAQHPVGALHQQQRQHSCNSSSDEDDHPINSSSKLSRATSPRYQQQQRFINQHRSAAAVQAQVQTAIQPSPVYSTSSSVTATPRNPSALQNVYNSNNNIHNNNFSSNTTSNRVTPDSQYMSVVTLDPATKRALESLQTEVIALNSRIDEIRRELVIRDQRDAVTAAAAKVVEVAGTKKKRTTSGSTLSSILPRRTISSESSSSGNGDDDMSDSWKWVIKAAAKHAAVNLITVFALLLILYKRGSPVAYVITGQASKLWENVKNRVLFQTVV
ncbi:hypothetical protein INT45_003328 [Circinella minor]|uniref:ACB domain-containing protein n=1 Tax=Circinella minor TaxID=1195481 RepID=A0A8H7SDS4_9FUNG|nr:hypothetical protein INT45_003328 [Circinella minor]